MRLINQLSFFFLRGLSGFFGGMRSTQCNSSFKLRRFLLTEQIDSFLHLFLYNGMINCGHISLKSWIHNFKPLHNSLPSKLTWKCLVLRVNHYLLLQDHYRTLTRCFECLNQILCYTSKYCMKTNKMLSKQS